MREVVGNVIVGARPAGPRLLKDHLLVQASAGDVGDAAALADRAGSGVVVSGEGALEAADRLNQTGLAWLVDRRRYAGRGRVPGTATFDGRWLARQRDRGAALVLSDSGYIGQHDAASLRCVLSQAAAASSNVTAVLPLHADWFSTDLLVLQEEIVRFGVPVAIVLEHARDPLSVRKTLLGFTQLLTVPVPVGLLSSDVSALGALAFGAAWAAVGVRSSLRHLYPVKDKGGGRTSPLPSALVDPALALIKVDKIAAGWAASQDDPAWVCDCTVCGGRTLDWMLAASPMEANAHTFERLLNRRDRLTSLMSGQDRRRSWRAQCRSAEFQYQALALVGVPWEVPGFLRYWQEA